MWQAIKVSKEAAFTVLSAETLSTPYSCCLCIVICSKARQQAKACKFLKVLRHSAESYWGKDVSPPLKIGDSSNSFLDRPNKREPTPDQCSGVRVLKGRRPTQERLPLPAKVRFFAEKETPW